MKNDNWLLFLSSKYILTYLRHSLLHFIIKMITRILHENNIITSEKNTIWLKLMVRASS